MDPRLLQYYNRELQHVREMGAEFAKEYPKVAGRLGMEDLECSDPYVERLLEGFAFLAARVQLKLDAEFPRFTQHMLELIYPHYLAPVPSMLVAQLQPVLTDPSLADGEAVPRNTALHAITAKGERTACEYRTAHDVTLWPLEITEVRYFPTTATLANINLERLGRARAGLRLRLRVTSGVAFDELTLDRLPVFLSGDGDIPKELYEQLLGNACGVVVRPKGGSDPWQVRLPGSSVRRHGFEPEQALLPYGNRSFDGYRLLQEYFAFPDRYRFFELTGLGRAVKRSSGTELEIVVLFDRSVGWLEGALDVSHFALFCTPAINLFPKRADRINVDRAKPEYHVLPDRTRPMDFEVHSLTSVQGYAGGSEAVQEFKPFYTSRDPAHDPDRMAYYTLNREPRMISSKLRRQGTRASYVGSELYLSLVDAYNAPFPSNLRQLEIGALCTNRDLPLTMVLGTGSTDFTLDVGAPVAAIRRVAGPTPPRASVARGETAWRLLSHLSLNYISIDQPGDDGARLLRQMLALYADPNSTSLTKEIEGVKAVESEPIVRRLPSSGPVSFGRGLEVTVTCDDGAFEKTGAFLLGSVLDEFFARYVSINSFTETVLRTVDRGEVMRWPTRIGRRHIL